MNKDINRREFLKLSASFLPTLFVPSFFARPSRGPDNADAKNILIIVFDAFSAKNASLYGYARDTTPNLKRIAEKAIIYHNHYAGGHWTFPGTSTLLTGVYPWTHRGFTFHKHVVAPYAQNNLFSLFDGHFRVAYTHNRIADSILKHFGRAIDHHQPHPSLLLTDQTPVEYLFPKDDDTAFVSWTRAIKKVSDGYANSLFLSNLYSLFSSIHEERDLDPLREKFPLDLPALADDNYFTLEDAIDWIKAQTLELPTPYAAYFHLLPPHSPYRPRVDSYNIFKDDGYRPMRKPEHFMTRNIERTKLEKNRKEYDEYILYVDAEFGRLYDFMEKEGILNNTWVILTSDHGEMFERGISGHGQSTFYQPTIRVPLLILEPGNQSRREITAPTTAVDLLPTLLHLNGQDIPRHLEGEILPPFSEDIANAGRPIFGIDAMSSEQLAPLTVASTMLVKEQCKFIYHFGYSELPNRHPYFELYDLRNDPEEMENLYTETSSAAQDLKAELLAKIREKDEVYL